ncbi:MAG TPA: hypothetical protein VI731_08350 [Bacteroidia bacterium]|nr:hypothetical protein [Bacteroidia bacterium]
MRKHKHLLSTLLIAAVFSACGMFNRGKKTSVDYLNEGYVKAFVTEYRVDGCTFMLQLEGEGQKRLEPDGLQPEFEHDSMRVWLKYQPEERMSICMAGQTIKVIDIKKRDD